MQPNAGFKPLKWNCETDGCFNAANRLDFSAFYSSLPGKMSFTDADGLAEYCGNGLLMEWKSTSSPLPTGQAIAYERLTRGKILTVLWIVGESKTMRADKVTVIFDGKYYNTPAKSTEDLNNIIKRWVSWSSSNVRFGGPR